MQLQNVWLCMRPRHLIFNGIESWVEWEISKWKADHTHIYFLSGMVLRFDLTFAHCHKSRTIYRNFTVHHLQMSYRGSFQLVWNPGQTSQSIASQNRTNLLAIIKSMKSMLSFFQSIEVCLCERSEWIGESRCMSFARMAFCIFDV